MAQENRIALYPLDFQKRDLVLILPGGGYAYTSPRESLPVAEVFHKAGYHAAIYEYRNRIVRHPQTVEDGIAEALELRKTRYVDRIFLCGFSAGAHLALALLEAKPKLFKGAILAYPVVTADPRFSHADSIANLLGEDRSDARIKEVSLERHVKPSMAPVFLWTTIDDASVPVENSLKLLDALRKKKVPVEAHFFPSGRHGLSLATEATPFNGEDPVKFAAENRHVAEWVPLALEWLKTLK